MKPKIAHQILEKVKLDYDQIAEDFSMTRQAPWKEFTLFKPYIKSNTSIADIGCGNGRLIRELPGNCTYTGVDISQNLINQAKKQFPNENFILGSLLEIPLSDDSADITFSIASLHHIPSEELREKAIQELYRITKPGGHVIITVWDLWQKKYLASIAKAFFKKALHGPHDVNDFFIPWQHKIYRYYHAFFRPELKRLLESKFNILELTTTPSHNLVAICQKPE